MVRRLFWPILVVLLVSAGSAWAQDEAAVRKVADAYAAGWNRHDSKMLADLFTNNAYWVDVHGGLFEGKKEIHRLHDAIHHRWQKTSKTVHTTTNVRFLNPNVAVSTIRWELRGDARGKQIRRGVMTFVVLKQADTWLIAAAQNTEIDQPAWAKQGVAEPLGDKRPPRR